jgi:phosphatidylserine/phosphatidylglycerophosphate/cardiolipin synthase-like enzyme
MKLFRKAFAYTLVLLVALSAAPPTTAGTPSGEVVARAFSSMQQESGLQMTKVRLLSRNMESWYARWYLLESAQKSIDVTYYIVEDDIFGRSMLGLLYKRAKEGLRVRLLVDARGTKSFTKRIFSKSVLQHMAGLPNVQVKVFNPIHKALHRIPSNIRNVMASNHDKIMLADGKLAVTGGRNISKNYFASPDDYPSCYRDTDVLLEGRGMGRQMELAFEEEFHSLQSMEVHEGWLSGWRRRGFELEVARRVMQHWIMGNGPYSEEAEGIHKLIARYNQEVQQYPSLTGYLAFQHDPWQGRRAFPVKVLDKHSFRGERNDITNNMISLIDAAEDYVLIQNPYVIMTPELFAALKRAGERNVRIVLHTNSPASTDSLITQAFFIRDWWKLLRDLPTLEIWVFKDERKLHAKTFVIDDRVTSIGTYNLDPMSQGINSEVMAVVESPTFGRRNRLRIEKDIEESVQYLIKVDPETGIVDKVSGPSQHLEGMKGFLISVLSKFGFLRPIV